MLQKKEIATITNTTTCEKEKFIIERTDVIDENGLKSFIFLNKMGF